MRRRCSVSTRYSRLRLLREGWLLVRPSQLLQFLPIYVRQSHLKRIVSVGGIDMRRANSTHIP